MKPATLLSLATGASLTDAIHINPSTPNGIYDALPDPKSPNSNLLRRHTPTNNKRGCPSLGCIDTFSGDTYPEGRLLQETLPLPKGKAFCRAENHTITQTDFHAAVNLLFHSSLFWIPPNTARFAVHNGAVVYICNLAGWAPGSLLEYMEAMRLLDEECGHGAGDEGTTDLRAAKYAARDWNRFYGREVRGVDSCQWESEKGGLQNELLGTENSKCNDYVNGISRYLGNKGKCNENATGRKVWEQLKALFPWYMTPIDQGNMGNKTAA